MATEGEQTDCIRKECCFRYQFTSNGTVFELSVPLKLPHAGNTRELALRLISNHHLPCSLEDDLVQRLEDCIREQSQVVQDAISEDTVYAALKDETVVEDRIREWVKRYTENTTEFCATREAPDDPFPAIYQSLLLSPVVMTILQLEHTYSIAMTNQMKDRDNATISLEERHGRELQEAMAKEGLSVTDKDINSLTRQHIMEKESLEAKWSTQLKRTEEFQKREYKDWLTRLFHEMEEENAENRKPSPRMGTRNHGRSSRRSVMTDLRTYIGAMSHDDEPEASPQQQLEESFTVNLGSQNKTSHNVRLLCGSVSAFLRTAHGDPQQGKFRLDPHQLQTAMSLYTNNLSALVVMEEARAGTVSSNRDVIASICQQSCDLHFSSIDDQLMQLNDFTEDVKQQRKTDHLSSSSTNTPAISQNVTPTHSMENISMDISESERAFKVAGSPHDKQLLHPQWRTESPLSHEDERESLTLEPGDFYVTRHSNLSKVHVLFHLATQRKAISNSSLSARHPIMQGLKMCLRTAAQHGIHNVTIPLLLVHRMEPEMTINWCLKRAELVFKSVKGFMLENSAWRGNETWTIQFLIPKGTSPDLFEQISDLLPRTFRIAATRYLKETVQQ